MAHANFKVGDNVEVTSSEHSLRGALFPAKVIGRNVKARNTFFVEYKFLKRKKAKGGFRGEVNVCMLRPSQPVHKNSKFNFGDSVDAFHKGGWYEGVITQVLEDSNFSIHFRFVQNQFNFSASKLRHHQEWIHGAWVPSVNENGEVTKKKALSLRERIREKIKEGSIVEVSSDEEGFEGAWFSATVVKAVGKDKFLVEYKSLKTEDEKEFLREEIGLNHIRPLPPDLLLVDGFRVGDEADAQYNEGWWEGRVTKVLSKLRYKVYFKKTDDEWEFDESKLRLHFSWIDATWVREV